MEKKDIVLVILLVQRLSLNHKSVRLSLGRNIL